MRCTPVRHPRPRGEVAGDARPYPRSRGEVACDARPYPRSRGEVAGSKQHTILNQSILTVPIPTILPPSNRNRTDRFSSALETPYCSRATNAARAGPLRSRGCPRVLRPLRDRSVALSRSSQRSSPYRLSSRCAPRGDALRAQRRSRKKAQCSSECCRNDPRPKARLGISHQTMNYGNGDFNIPVPLAPPLDMSPNLPVYYERDNRHVPRARNTQKLTQYPSSAHS